MKALRNTVAVLAVLSEAFLFYAWAGERPRLRLQHYRLALPGGAGAGLRLLHLADQHFAGDNWVRRRRLRHLRRLLPSLRPDLILFTGDFLHNDAGLDAVEEMLRLLPPARLGRYAVLGNHDYVEYSWSQFFGGAWQAVAAAPTLAQRLAAAGQSLAKIGRLAWQILRNERLRFARVPNNLRELRALLELYDVHVLENAAVSLPAPPALSARPEHELWLAGIDDPSEGAPDLTQVLAAIPPTATAILLTHNPDLAYDIPPGRVALALAGHTHGGQVVLPLLGAVHTQGTRLPRHHAAGYFADLPGGTHMIVSRGMGESTPFRFHCPPEVVMIELVGDGEKA